MLKAISLYCGIGISDLCLYEAAKYLGIEVEIVAAYDNWAQAIKVYNANLRPMAQIQDVGELKSLPPCDFIFGGPPCQPYSTAGKHLGQNDPRDMMPKTIELISEKDYLIENVTKVLDAPFIERFTASTFGDCTIRRRVFHSSRALLSPPVLHARTTIGDIREYEEDERIFNKWAGREKADHHGHYDNSQTLQSLTQAAWRGHDTRGKGKLIPILLRTHKMSERIMTNEEPFGSLTGRAWHLINTKESGCRNPSILEMQRAHSIPEDWAWLDSTKTEKGKMIANSWPLKMGTSVFISFLKNFNG